MLTNSREGHKVWHFVLRPMGTFLASVTTSVVVMEREISLSSFINPFEYSFICVFYFRVLRQDSSAMVQRLTFHHISARELVPVHIQNTPDQLHH